MNWHPEILPLEQRQLWDSRLSSGFPGWVLYGGTALALRLGHRQSVDFDFFSAQNFSPLNLREHLQLDGEVLQAAPNTLTILHCGVKLSFFGGLTLRVLKTPDFFGRCLIASIEDLAACKLAALVNRVELKDYLDIAALLKNGMPLEKMLGCAQAVYRGEFPVASSLKSLTWFDPPELHSLAAEDREILEKASLAVRALPVISPLAAKIGSI